MGNTESTPPRKPPQNLSRKTTNVSKKKEKAPSAVSKPPRPECKICFVPYDEKDHFPMMLGKCGHTFCLECCRSLRACPYNCAFPIQLTKNFVIIQFIRPLPEVPEAGIREDPIRAPQNGAGQFQKEIEEIMFQNSPEEQLDKLMTLGRLHCQNGDYSEAINNFTEALDLNPTPETLSELINFRGFCYNQIGNFAEAEIDFREALRLNPTHLEAKYALSQIFQQTGRQTQAVQLRVQILQTPPKHHADFNSQGLVLLNSFCYREALDRFDQAIKKYPQESVYYQNRALCYRYLKNYRKAEGDYKRCVELNPNNTKALVQAAQFFHNELRHYDQAVKYYTMEIEQVGEESKSYAQRGICFMKLKEYQKAVEDFQMALLNDPDNPQARKNLDCCPSGWRYLD